MKPSEIYLKLLRWGIYLSLFIPLVIFSQYISPFHFGKAVIFRSLVEIMAVIYILLIASTGKKHLPKFTPLITAITVFTGLYALASFTAVDFNFAFWGTLERMGGLFSFLHFWVWFIILISVFKTKQDWKRLLKISVFVGFLSVLFAYGQRFKLGDFFVGWQHESRVIGTIGNAALFAGYLLFVIFLSLYLLLETIKEKIENKQKLEIVLYGGVLILGIPVLHMTAVRGSIAAFWGGLFLLGLIYLFGLKNRKKLKILVASALILLLILTALIWANKDSEWVQDIHWLERMTDISLQSRTLQTRLWSWQSGWEGFKEKPILGWGPENFVIAHATHFKPGHFTGMGSETIWDRAHNIFLEMLTTMGILGFLSYFSMFAIIFYLLIKRFKQKKVSFNFMAILGVMFIVYIVHNSFIFDTTANYLVFFLSLGYVNAITANKEKIKKQQLSAEKGFNPFLALILGLLAIVLIYKTNIEPAKANYACTRAILAGRAGNVQAAMAKYQEAFAYKTYQGQYEIRHRFATFAIQYNQVLKKKDKQVNADMLEKAIKEVNINIHQHSNDYVPPLYLARLYILLLEQKPELAKQEVEKAVQKALEINDKNPRVWYELGQARLSLKKYDQAVDAFKVALELNPDVTQSYWFLGMSQLKAGEFENAKQNIEKAIQKGYAYKSSLSDIIRLIDLYSNTKDYYKLIELYETAIELQPENAQLYASLAVIYAKVGEIEKAISYAQKAGEIDESFKSEAEQFINNLKSD